MGDAAGQLSNAKRATPPSPEPPNGSAPHLRWEEPAPPGIDGGGQTSYGVGAPVPSLQPTDGPTHGGFRSAILLGSDRTELGKIAIEEITPALAIGISCGRFRKGYPHVDPNEDAVLATTDGITTILAVADGHDGFDAARAAITSITEATTSPLTNEAIQSIVGRLTIAATGAVAASVPPPPPHAT